MVGRWDGDNGKRVHASLMRLELVQWGGQCEGMGVAEHDWLGGQPGPRTRQRPVRPGR